jgi:hypothetical protein
VSVDGAGAVLIETEAETGPKPELGGSGFGPHAPKAVCLSGLNTNWHDPDITIVRLACEPEADVFLRRRLEAVVIAGVHANGCSEGNSGHEAEPSGLIERSSSFVFPHSSAGLDRCEALWPK